MLLSCKWHLPVHVIVHIIACVMPQPVGTPSALPPTPPQDLQAAGLLPRALLGQRLLHELASQLPRCCGAHLGVRHLLGVARVSGLGAGPEGGGCCGTTVRCCTTVLYCTALHSALLRYGIPPLWVPKSLHRVRFGAAPVEHGTGTWGNVW